VKDPNSLDATKRKITLSATEKASDDTVVGNPTVGGGSLEVRVSGGTPSSQTYNLPTGNSNITGKPFWSAISTIGFKYKDPKGENGPVKALSYKKTPAGVFKIAVAISAKFQPVTVLPPNPGSDSCSLLTINGGDTYSVAIGAGTGAVISAKNTSVIFKATKPTSEATCVTTTTGASTTTSTTLYGSPSRAFTERVLGLLD